MPFSQPSAAGYTPGMIAFANSAGQTINAGAISNFSFDTILQDNTGVFGAGPFPQTVASFTRFNLSSLAAKYSIATFSFEFPFAAAASLESNNFECDLLNRQGVDMGLLFYRLPSGSGPQIGLTLACSAPLSLFAAAGSQTGCRLVFTNYDVTHALTIAGHLDGSFNTSLTILLS